MYTKKHGDYWRAEPKLVAQGLAECQGARLRPIGLRRGSLGFSLRFKRRLVEAAGVEPVGKSMTDSEKQ